MKGLAILGSTGSIGTQTLDVVRSFPDDFRVVALAAGRNVELLEAQIKEFHPKLVFCNGSDDEKASLVSNGGTACSMEDMVRDGDVDLVVTATAGCVALDPTYAALEAGKNVALANKESMVMGGQLLVALAQRHNAELLPVDSEPNAIWQCLRGDQESVSKLIITASGGAFRDSPPEKMADVSPEQALNHPTWKMGPKITIDSATMMNKAFEVIEAHWLFGVPWEKIDVVIHPESMIHSMVEFVDGSVKAHISSPDMRLPIQYALFYPERVRNDSTPKFDPVATGALTFQALASERYPCFDLGLETAMKGGTWPAALCGADDQAVELFLSRQIRFIDIAAVIREALECHETVTKPSLDDLHSAAAWARKRVLDLVEG